MAVEIATAYVNIVPSARGFGRALGTELGGQLTAAGAAAGHETGQAFERRFLDRVLDATKRAATLTAAIGTGIATAAAGWGLKIASDNEQATISFETMLGSAEEAAGFLDEMKRFAATTPFEFPDLQKAASSLVSIGVETDKIIPIMTTLGDVTSGMGTGAEGVRRATIALQQMNAAGRITAEDLNQLRDAGIPVFDLLSAATGKTKAEVVALAKEGGLGAEELGQLMKALETGKGLERFAGLMEKQSQTLAGLLSTFKDVLGQGLSDVLGPVIPILKQALADLSVALKPLLGILGPLLGRLVGQLANGLVKLMGPLAGILEAVGAVAGELLDAFMPVLVEMGPILHSVIDMLAGGLILAFKTLAPTVLQLVRAFEPLLPVVARIVAVEFVLLVQILGEVIKALMPVIETVAMDMAVALTDMEPIIIDLVHALLPLFPALTDIFKALAPMVGMLITFQTRVLAKLLPKLIPLVEKFVEWAAVLLEQLVPAIERVVDWVTRFMDAFLEGDTEKMGAIADEASRFIDERLGQLMPAFTRGLDILFLEFKKWWDATAWPWIEQKGKEISDWFWGWVKEQTDKLPVTLQAVADGFVAWLKTEGPKKMAEAGKAIFLAFVNTWVDALNVVIKLWNDFKLGEVKVGDRTIFEGFDTPNMDVLTKIEGFARGGRPPLDAPSIVGELGPELFWPDSAGTIVANDKLNAMGGFNIEHLEVTGQDRPNETAFALRRELRWLSMTGGGI